MTRNLYFKHGSQGCFTGYVKIDTRGKSSWVKPDGIITPIINGPYRSLSQIRKLERDDIVKQIDASEAQELAPSVKISGFRKNPKNTKRFVVIPAPQKLTIKYQTSRGEIKDYTVTPIEKKANGFTGYAFGRGIRFFDNDRILSVD